MKGLLILSMVLIVIVTISVIGVVFMTRIFRRKTTGQDFNLPPDSEPPDFEPPNPESLDLTSPDSDDESQKIMLFIARAFVLLLYGALSFVPSILFIVYFPQTLPYSVFSLIASPIFWFWMFFMGKVNETEIAVLVCLGKPIRIVKRGPIMRYAFIDKIVSFSLESKKEIAGSVGEEGGFVLDIYTQDRKYIVIKIEQVWRVFDPLKYLINRAIVEDGITIKSFMIAAIRRYCGGQAMEFILENGKKQLPGEINEDLKDLFLQWGIERVGDPRIVDLDPIESIKTEMKAVAAAEYNRTKTLINADAEARRTVILAEAQRDQRMELAKAQEKEGFVDAAVNAKQVELRQKARIEALGITPGEEAVRYDIAEKTITEAMKNIKNITTVDGTGIVRIITEAAEAASRVFKKKEE